MSLPSVSSAGQNAINETGLVIPDWLTEYTVEQDTSRYTSVDHAVWRFVLLQMHERLRDTAHPAYARGLADSGISCERIPSVAEMNRCLGRIGWGAVCVDGFIPPRAFQGFQAAGILPIAAEIRSPQHLPYTPAPDIIHEAAGHAPILQDPAYAAYIRASGEVARRAFASPADHAVYSAIFALSALKEDPEHSQEQALCAERALEAALAQATAVSEAAKIARLYWWTAEYGLVGSVKDYKLYGAGLLSSLWESYACHDAKVEKRLLTCDCVNVDYDITHAQPQLFVARDFEHLSEVLDQVDATLAHRIGGTVALAAAAASQELCTVTLDDTLEIVGKLGDIVEGVNGVAGFGVAERAQYFYRAYLVAIQPARSFVALGPLSDGTRAADLRSGTWRRYLAGTGLQLPFASGLLVSGTPIDDPNSIKHRDGLLELRDLRVQRGDVLLFEATQPSLVLLSDTVVTVAAGSNYAQLSSSAAQTGPCTRPRVPKIRPASQAAARLQALYDAMFKVRARLRERVLEPVQAIHQQLSSDLSHEWLLRWNLLDCLRTARQEGELSAQLRCELEALELYYERRYPIAMGLDYLAQAT